MRMLGIRAVEPLDGYRLRLTLTDGRIVERDVAHLLNGPLFDGIRRDPAALRQVFADKDSGLAEWGRPLPGRAHLRRYATG